MTLKLAVSRGKSNKRAMGLSNFLYMYSQRKMGWVFKEYKMTVSIVSRRRDQEPGECRWAIHTPNSSKQLDSMSSNVRWVKPRPLRSPVSFQSPGALIAIEGQKSDWLLFRAPKRPPTCSRRAPISLNQSLRHETVLRISCNQLCSYTVVYEAEKGF